MLAKAPTPAAIEAAIERLVDDWPDDLPLPPEGPPTPDGPGAAPPLPPIEEVERQPRRRKRSNLRCLDQHVHEDGIDWVERIAIARPGYRIIGIRQRTSPGHPSRTVVHTRRIRSRRRKTNGNGGGSDA